MLRLLLVLFVAGAVLLPASGCSKSVRDGHSLGLHTHTGAMYQTWRHLAAGRGGFSELYSTGQMIARGQGITETVETCQHLSGGTDGLVAVTVSIFTDFLGPYTFTELGETFWHLR